MIESVKQTRVNIYLPEEDVIEFDKIAKERRLSRSSLCRESMIRTINEHKKSKLWVKNESKIQLRRISDDGKSRRDTRQKSIEPQNR